MSTPQNGAIATVADWKMAEVVYDVFAALLSRKPAVAAEMAEEMHAIAQRYAEQYMPKRAGATVPTDAR